MQGAVCEEAVPAFLTESPLGRGHLASLHRLQIQAWKKLDGSR